MRADESSESTEQIKRVTIVLPTEVHEMGKKLAAQDHRNFSGQVAAMIEAEAKRKKESEVAA